MDKMERLRAGAAEMRSVARRLMEWAEDLEDSFQAAETGAAEVPAAGPGADGKKKKAAGPAGREQAGDAEAGKALTLPEVRKILAEKCAAGFGAQVRALIENCGASTLKDVPAGKYGALAEAAGRLGGGGGPDA